MAPQPVVGFWERHTSTIDWCEENYAVTTYIAEFWNTVSNCVLIIGPLVMLSQGLKHNMERRYIIAFSVISVIGIGSLLFHMTLRYSMQLMDEVPMLWGSAAFIYAGLTVKSDERSDHTVLQAVLYGMCFCISLVYILQPIPLILQISYAVLNLAVIILSTHMMLTMESVKRIFLLGLLSYMTGFLLWSIDYAYCSHLRYIRETQIARFSGMMFQLHAWWHIFTGTGAYLGLLFTVHTRYLYFQRNPQIKFVFGIWPYVYLPQRSLKTP
ncbi:hypothetical protein RRG08_065722 [Elysia crispata]|uniref:Alkaline ceramidase n=1 Tax=Elysia crispata TaxID=231223 RepID=A0AAE0Z6P7_9GAST|nr:hypothetical protein RRG08_065722 [Elysia crispata]